MNYYMNLEFQKKHFEKIILSYKEDSDHQKTSAKMHSSDKKRKKYIYILCDQNDLLEILIEVFYINRQLIPSTIEDLDSILLKHSYLEDIKMDLGMRRVNISSTLSYPIGDNTVIISDKLQKDFLEQSHITFVLRKPDLFEAKRLANYRTQFCESRHELNRGLLKLRLFYHLPEYIKIPEMSMTKVVNLSLGNHHVFLSMKVAEKLSKLDFAENNRNRITNEYTDCFMSEYNHGAISLLEEYLREYQFSNNFLYVQIYLDTREIERMRFRTYFETQVLPEYLNILNTKKTNSEMNNLLLESKVISSIDTMITDALKSLRLKIEKANQEVVL